MAWFKQKQDPITDRARALNEQIARLEAQIQALSNQHPGLDTPSTDTEPSLELSPQSSPVTAESTIATPHAVTLPSGNDPVAAKDEPAFEEVSHNPFKGTPSHPRRESSKRDLGVRKSDFTAIWKRFRSNFRGPATSNPQLVKYIAAGSLQGLRPTRYEKRVARNRFILLLLCLVVVLWGIITMWIRR